MTDYDNNDDYDVDDNDKENLQSHQCQSKQTD